MNYINLIIFEWLTILLTIGLGIHSKLLDTVDDISTTITINFVVIVLALWVLSLVPMLEQEQ